MLTLRLSFDFATVSGSAAVLPCSAETGIGADMGVWGGFVLRARRMEPNMPFIAGLAFPLDLDSLPFRLGSEMPRSNVLTSGAADVGGSTSIRADAGGNS